VAELPTNTMKQHLILVTNREYRTVCGCNPNAPTAKFVESVTCRRCLKSAARLIDNGLAQVSQTYLMHKDKTRTPVSEELVLISQNDEWWHRRGQAPIQLATLSPVATHGLFCLGILDP
jgi:hypothetical protein